MEDYAYWTPQILYETGYSKSDGHTWSVPLGQFYSQYRDLQSSGIIKSNFHDPNYWWFNKRYRTNRMDAFYSDAVAYRRYVGPYWNMPEGLNTWHGSELSWVDAKAYGKLADEIRGGLDLSIDGFQLRQTLALMRNIRNVVDRTVSLVADTLLRSRYPHRIISKRDVRRARLVRRLNQRYKSGQHAASDFDLAKIPADLWLQYTYGVKPTLDSIYGGITTTKNHYFNLSKMFEGRAKSTRQDVVKLPWYLDGTWHASVEIHSSVRVKYKVRMEIPDDSSTEAARYTSLNPVSIVYELLPYSFVVDWFLNIGGYLRSVETRLIYGQFFKSGFKTTTWMYVGELDGRRLPVVDATVGGYHKCSSIDKDCKREVLHTMPFPPTPTLKVDLGAARLTSAAALLTSFLHR